MRFLAVLAATLFAVGCGKDSGGGGSNDDPTEQVQVTDGGPMTKLVAAGELPPCAPENEAQLVYEDTVGFKHCKAGAWVAIDIKGDKGDKGDAGASGTAGVGVKEVVSGKGDGTDYCTEYADDSCWLDYVDVTIFADDMWFVNIKWNHLQTTGGDVAVQDNDVGFMFKRKKANQAFILDRFVSRGDGAKMVFALFPDFSDGEIQLRYDTNENFKHDSTDADLDVFFLK